MVSKTNTVVAEINGTTPYDYEIMEELNKTVFDGTGYEIVSTMGDNSDVQFYLMEEQEDD